MDGHFGLAAHDYTHSTAPNRRFADLVTQRLLKALLANAAAPYTDDELDAIARNCTLKEDAARKVQRDMTKRIAAVALAGTVGQTVRGGGDGRDAEGRVRAGQRAAGGRPPDAGEEGVDVGDEIEVTLMGTDPQRGFIDFGRIFMTGWKDRNVAPHGGDAGISRRQGAARRSAGVFGLTGRRGRPEQILAHICDLFDWALTLADGKQAWNNSKPQAWEADMARFFGLLEAFDRRLASGVPLGCEPEKPLSGSGGGCADARRADRDAAAVWRAARSRARIISWRRSKRGAWGRSRRPRCGSSREDRLAADEHG